MNPDYVRLLRAPAEDLRDLFLATARRVATAEQNVEKDFWVCWTLDLLFNGGLAPGGPRLLFKGGTSLSKAFGLIERFSEDIDVTVFRDDLGEGATIDQLGAMTGKKRRAKLDAIREACRVYVTGPMLNELKTSVSDALKAAGLPLGGDVVEVDTEDPDGQTLLVWYPSVTRQAQRDYIRPVVRIECGAKSALDPNRPAILTPYANRLLDGFDLAVGSVTTVESARTFWDKVVIVHGLRRWYERRGTLPQEGQRVSRHYYDLHSMLRAGAGRVAARDRALGQDCGRHARMFFHRPDFDLDSALPGSLAVEPSDGMLDVLRRDYAAMAGMIFGVVPLFDEVLDSIREINALVNIGEGAGKGYQRCGSSVAALEERGVADVLVPSCREKVTAPLDIPDRP